MNFFFICPSNRQANLTNQHCTSESVFVACAHIASVNYLLGVWIPHRTPISFLVIHHFSAVTQLYLNNTFSTLQEFDFVTMLPGWPYNKLDLTIERNYTLFGHHDTRKAWPTQLSMIFARFQCLRTSANTTSGKQYYQYITSFPFFTNKQITAKENYKYAWKLFCSHWVI